MAVGNTACGFAEPEPLLLFFGFGEVDEEGRAVGQPPNIILKKSGAMAMKKEFKNVNIKEVGGDVLAEMMDDFNEFQTDESGVGRQFWVDLLIKWHTKKERLLRHMKLTKSTLYPV